jgi:hypothetical protein
VFYAGVVLAGAALGGLVAVVVLALAGALVRIPGVLPLLARFLSADLDAPLMWMLMVSSWLLGIVVIYSLVNFVRRSPRGPRS